jgi:glycosyltransferase involved in cell wall biosynthesis
MIGATLSTPTVTIALISHSWSTTTGAGRCAVELRNLLAVEASIRLVEERFVEPPRRGLCAKAYFKVRRLVRLASMFRRHSVRVVVVNTTVQSSVAVAARAAGCRVIWWCHEPNESVRDSALMRFRAALYDVLADTVVAVSSACVRTKKPAIVVRNIVTSHPTPRPKGPPVLLVMGTKSRQKGTDLLPLLIDPFLGEGTAQLWLVGNDDSRDQTLLAETRLKLELAWGSRLRWCGSVDEVHDTYGQASVLLLPSRQEARGRVVEEALAHGVPVLASKLPGLAEVAQTATRPSALRLLKLDEDWTPCIEQMLKERLPRVSLIEEFTKEDFVATWLRVIREAAGT